MLKKLNQALLFVVWAIGIYGAICFVRVSEIPLKDLSLTFLWGLGIYGAIYFVRIKDVPVVKRAVDFCRETLWAIGILGALSLRKFFDFFRDELVKGDWT